MSMLKEKLMAKLGKKKDVNPLEKEAKMNIVKEMGRQAGSMMKDKVGMHPMAKVEVASDSKHGLHQGLQKADELLAHAGGPGSLADHTGSPADMEADEAGEESHEPMMADAHAGDDEDAELMAEHQDHSPEELEQKIAKLTELKHKKQSGLA